MKYSWNVASEALRLQPPSFGTFREVITDFDYNGFLFPKGWKLHWAALGIHKNPEYFPDPEKFDPSRFEGNQERVPFSYVPFGGGPHICPGKEYARIQILVFIHNVITKFRWEKLHWAMLGTQKNPEYFPDPEKLDPSRFEANQERVPFSYVPFGGGPHICPGKEYARLQIPVFMHNVITKFRAFTDPAALQNYVGLVDAVVKEHLLRYWECKQQVKVQTLAEKFTSTLACRLFLNIHDSETVEELDKLFNILVSGLISLPINLPGTRYNRAIKASKELGKKFEAMIRQRRIDVWEKKKSDESKEDIFSLLVQEKYKDGENVSESDLANNIIALIFAAHSATSATMMAIINFLAELPQIYKGVLEEHMEIAKSKGPEELLNFEDIRKMKYSWNVASEVLRLVPPGFGAFREALTDFEYSGFIIPKGCKLHWTLLGTHKNPEYFPDPEKFDPSRFEGNRQRVPFSYAPFGGGPHICPGREYARLQILVFLHNVITKFRWEKLHWGPLATQKNPDYFPDPEKFDPSRFEGNQERVPFSYVPFGGGPHICPDVDEVDKDPEFGINEDLGIIMGVMVLIFLWN
ncbi:Cytochrome P450 [Melia azedarach]|uniref:Cytochrome P450 n=1 Tax=Melia azedarach TaxID=155640 RepID=A0ACC1YKE2_MELAZ|nr:Cytochrome P450 [Melia azedarach]